MRLAWLLLVIPGVYAQSMFDPIKDLAISLGPENINLLLTFWISYLILNFAIKLTPIFGSDSAHNQGGSIAVAMAAATTYFVYITKFNFIGAIMPFIVFLVVGALILLISKLFGKTGGFKSGRLIVTGILMILISLTLMGSASLYTTAILGSTLSWLPETIFAIGIVLIMLGGVMTLGAPTGDSNITDSNILKAAGKPFGWLWSKTGKKLWNRVRGTPEEAPAPENQNQEIQEGIIVAPKKNIYPNLSKTIEEDIHSLRALYTNLTKENELTTEIAKQFDKVYQSMNNYNKQLKIVLYFAHLCEFDANKLINLGKRMDALKRSMNPKNMDSLKQLNIMAEEFNSILGSYKKSRFNHRKFDFVSFTDKHEGFFEKLADDFGAVFEGGKVKNVNAKNANLMVEHKGDEQNIASMIYNSELSLDKALRVLYYQLQKLKGMNGKLQEDIESLEGYTREILMFSENAKTTTTKLVQNSEKLLEMSKYLVSLQKQVVQTHNKLSSTRSLDYSGKFFQPKVNVSESEILSGNI